MNCQNEQFLLSERELQVRTLRALLALSSAAIDNRRRFCFRSRPWVAVMLLRFLAASFVLLSLSVVEAQETVSLLDGDDPKKDWSFNNGGEFPGAKGALTVEPKASRRSGCSATSPAAGSTCSAGGKCPKGASTFARSRSSSAISAPTNSRSA
jgi:hypothetical protein